MTQIFILLIDFYLKCEWSNGTKSSRIGILNQLKDDYNICILIIGPHPYELVTDKNEFY